MNSASEMQQLWRVKKTVMQLCHDRGYLVTSDELNETLGEFKGLYGSESLDEPIRSKLTMIFTHSITGDKLMTYFPLEMTIKKPDLVSYCQIMKKAEVNRAILILRDTITPVARKSVGEFAPTFIMELFWEAELLVNIMDHEFVPKHTVLTSQQKDDLFSKYNLSENLLMRMQSSDPVAKYFGLKRGQVVKIIRNSETAGRYVTYRLVC